MLAVSLNGQVVVATDLTRRYGTLSYPVGSLIALAGVLAAVAPARRASRLVLESLQYE